REEGSLRHRRGAGALPRRGPAHADGGRDLRVRACASHLCAPCRAAARDIELNSAMCGLAGIFEFDPAARPDRRLLERMTDLVAHRGPDDSGYLENGPAALGHRRLSIIDLSAAGHQPMANDDASIWIAYNGECYNYLELARE